MKWKLGFWAMASVALLAGSAPARADPRQEFVDAMRRIAQHQADLPDSAELSAYPIHEYLIAARLRRDLAQTPGVDLDERIDAFMRAHATRPVVRNLKREWLASLAERQRWDWFLPRSVDVVDAALGCDRLTGRLATGDTHTLGPDVLARWRQTQKQPDECNAIFAWLRTQDLITPELAESRARGALALNNFKLAREFTDEVPAARQAPLLRWAELLESPKTVLTSLAQNPESPVEADALVAGFNRLAFSDISAARELLPPLLRRPDLDPPLRERLQRSAALGAASSRVDGAVAAFDILTDDPNDVPVQEWRVRAALWAGDYVKARTWLEKMPTVLASQPRWRYWHARAVAVTAGATTAAPLFGEIAGMRDYYGYLAADHLDQPYNLNIRATAVDAVEQSTLAAEPGLIRAHALFDCNMADDAAAEFSAILATAKPALKVQAARLVSDWGWYAQAIATLAQAGEWDDVPLRYPRPYLTEVAEAAKQTQVPGDWLLAVMRQESLFRRDAVSRADARGVMQMLPATALAVAKRCHLPAPLHDGLFDPAIAVPLGACYLRELLDRYTGRLELALAAYNAGPVSVARWMPARRIDADVWIENIPYNETRAYVQHILEHIVAFAAVRSGELPKLSTLLPPVEPTK